MKPTPIRNGLFAFIVSVTVITIVAVVIMLFIFRIQAAQSHSWYDPECCSENDCAPVTKYTQGADGAFVTSKIGTVWVPKTFKHRPSKDGQMHVCMSLGRPHTLFCVYKSEGM
jgi:hypothetical protein